MAGTCESCELHSFVAHNGGFHRGDEVMMMRQVQLSVPQV